MDLLSSARDHLEDMREQLAAHGAPPAIDLDLRPTSGPLSHYDLRDGQIYVGELDRRSESRLIANYLCHILALDRRSVGRLFRDLLPWTLAHELAHHLRHRAGAFGADRWSEEMVATQLASALCPPRARDSIRDSALLRAALNGLAARGDLSESVFVDSYLDLPIALAAVGELPLEVARSSRRLGRALGVDPADLIARDPDRRAEIERRLAHRRALKRAFNARRLDPRSQLYQQLGWVHVATAADERCDVEEWIRTYLPPRERELGRAS